MSVTLQVQKKITYKDFESDYVGQLNAMIGDLEKQGFAVDVQSEDDD